MSFTGLKERLLTMDYFKDFKFAYFSPQLYVSNKSILFINTYGLPVPHLFSFKFTVVYRGKFYVMLLIYFKFNLIREQTLSG